MVTAPLILLWWSVGCQRSLDHSKR
ncbi:hypothetical protein LINPERPRIM_LOCUS37741 [Linum perenne]